MTSHRHTAPGQHEHEFEAVHGLPEDLPTGERLLWQGAPDWKLLAVRVFHVRAIAIYFALLFAWRASDVLLDGGGVGQALLAVALLSPLALLALGLLAMLAWLSARTAVYTITSRRVILRIGIVLSVTYNLPHRQIHGASLHGDSAGRGDIALQLAPGSHIAYLQLWPHARPWQLRRPQPALRCIPEATRVGALLTQAIAAVPAELPVRLADNAPTPPSVHGTPDAVTA